MGGCPAEVSQHRRTCHLNDDPLQRLQRIIRIYPTTQRDGVDYNLAFMDPGFIAAEHEQFDPVYMRRMFDYGYTKGRSGYPWGKEPPILMCGCGRKPLQSSREHFGFALTIARRA